jgi:hypothetical protein
LAEDLFGGPAIGSLSCTLRLYRGKGGHPDLPRRGIGTFEFNEWDPELRAILGDNNDEGLGAWLSGSWWMPEVEYDEIWAQVREHTYTSCDMSITIGPGDGRHWDVS